MYSADKATWQTRALGGFVCGRTNPVTWGSRRHFWPSTVGWWAPVNERRRKTQLRATVRVLAGE